MAHTLYLDYPKGTTFAIWPFDPETKKCLCGDATCTDAGKHPRLNHPPVPGQGYGIMLGSIENGGCGYFAVDVDDPAATLPGELTPTRQHYTGREGGQHVLYLCPGARKVKNSRSVLAKGVDIKGDGGWIVGPGSPHVSGRVYSVALDHPVARAPQWLLDWDGLYRSEAGLSGEYSPTALTPGTPQFDRAAGVLRKYCETTENVDGSNALLAVGQCALRCEIQPSDALPIVKQYFNTRAENSRTGETEWQDWEILHKLEDTWQNIYNLPTGVGWMAEDLQARLERAALPEAMKVEPHEERIRNQPDPRHVYTFRPGFDEVTHGDKPAKASAFDLARTFRDHHEWRGVFQFDELAQKEIAVNPPMPLDMEREGQTRTDLAKIQIWLQCRGMLAGIDAIENAVSVACKDNSYHPIREYLDRLPLVEETQAESYLGSLASEWFGETCGHQEATYLTRFLVAAVKRIYEPGTEVHNMLVLYGKGAMRKTSWVKELFGEPYMKSQMPTLEGRDASHALRGKWAIEIGELASLLRTETSAAKEFLSRNVDEYRQYGNGKEVIRPRQCVFVGTTNEPQFLRDSTGNRRFWPIHVTRRIPKHLDRDAVWAAARSLALANYRHWEELEESEAAEGTKLAYIETDPWHEEIAELLKDKEFVKVKDLWSKLAPGAGLAALDRRTQMRITDTLRRLGCSNRAKKIAGVLWKVWEIPDDVRNAKTHLSVVK